MPLWKLLPCLCLAVTLLPLLGMLASGQESADGEDDPFLWLEEVLGEESLDWVRERNAKTTGELAENPEFERLRDRLLAILDSDERIPSISKAGEHYYNLWRDAQNPRGLWRRTSLAEYRQDEPAWETVLDLDDLAKKEDENWVWKGATFLRPDCTRCLISLSRGGADAVVVREFDLERTEFIAAGFTLPEAKSDVAWRTRDEIFVGTDFGAGSLTESGYPRVAKLWKRGAKLADAPTVFEGRVEDVGVEAYRDLTPGFERDFVRQAVTFWTSKLYLLRDGQAVEIAKPDDAIARVHREWLLLELRTDWAAGERKFTAGSLIAAKLNEHLAGQANWNVLFEPTARTSLGRVSGTRNHLLLTVLDNVRTRIDVLTPTGEGWQSQTLPGVPELSTASAWAVDSHSSDAYFLSTSDYLTPPSLRLGEIGNGPAAKLKTTPEFFDASGLKVTQHQATSADGTQIPYFQVAREDLQLDGSHPTLLYGYGGFEIPLLPGYRAAAGAAWLERGGVYVVANIRGGGEFGPKWHQAALKQNRKKAYDDFIAVAEDLISRKVTSSQRLGIQGGSNGGLLMGNMLTRRPDLFAAIVCQVPLLDMRRYHKLLAGASWVAEYGDPDKPEEWAFLRNYSPYHNVSKDQRYPRTLFMTSTRDDRVHPGHARKMAARMLHLGHDALYFENIEGGHGGAADNKQRAFMQALAYTFLWKQLTK